MNSGCFRSGKRIDPGLRKQKRLDKSTNARCGPFVPILLHLNVEDLSANKICVMSQLATRHRALLILLQETHSTNADQLVIPHFTLTGWVSSRKYGLTTFVHENFSLNLVDQSSERSVIE